MALVGVYVDCDRHGIQQNSTWFDLPPGTEFDLTPVEGVVDLGAPCPVCGEMAEIISGAYYQDAFGGWRAQLRPTQKQAEKLWAAIDSAKQQLADPAVPEDVVREQLVANVKRAAPQLVALFDRILSDRTMKVLGLISFLLALLACFGIYGPDLQPDEDPRSVTESDVRELVDEYLREHAGDTPLPPEQTPPTPTPPSTGQSTEDSR